MFGRDQAGVERALAGRERAALRERGVVVGTGDEAREQVQRLGEAGVQRVMLQWMDLDDLQGLEGVAHALLGN
ncbi:MAG: hypothetical protein NVSMB42_26510 [Herpetosiphon sp.]